MMAILPHNIMSTTILLAVMMVLVAGDASLMKMNRTSTTATPKVQPSTVTTKTTVSTTPPPFAAVMDLFQAPLEAFKPKMSAIQHEETAQLPMSRGQSNVAVTPNPPISNIFLNAGQGLGNAASSLTGWFNNRMIPMALRAPTSTTKTPKVIIRVPNQQANRKPLTAVENKRKPQAHRNKPVIIDTDDMEGYEEVFVDDEENFNANHDEIENGNADEDEDEYEYKPLKTKKGSRQTKKQPNLEYFYIEENQGDDDFDYDLQLPVRKTQHQQQQQNLNNRRRKNSPNKKTQQNGPMGPNQKKRKPVRKNQNAQVVQLVQNGPSNTQVKRQRRPAASFELIPISQNQAINYIQKRKPSSTSQNSQKRPSQFINIPWSRLGFAGPPKETTSSEQQSKPILVQIPQQTLNNKRRPAKKPTKVDSKPKRKPLRGQLQNQSPVFSLLSENEIRDLFQSQETQPPKMTQTSNETLKGKKKPPMEVNIENDTSSDDDADMETEENPQAEQELENYEKDIGSYIVVGPADDDAEIEVDLSNHRGFQRGRFSQRSRQQMDTEDYYE